MFRKRQSNAKKLANPAAPVGEAGPGTLWYKKPAGVAPASPHQTEDPLQSPIGRQPRVSSQTFPHSPPYYPVNSPGAESRQTTAIRGQSPALTPVRFPGGSPLANNGRQTPGRRDGGFASMQSPDRPQSNVNNISTADLVKAILRENDWESVRSILDSSRSVVRQKTQMTLMGQNTMAYPLHAAIVMRAPSALFEEILAAFSDAAHIADEASGRLPLHWACLAGASEHILKKLVEVYPAATRVMDKINGRLPLHYIVMHAMDIRQVTIILESEPRGVKTKDKQSKTPLDMVHATTSPLKLDILAEMQKRRKKRATLRSEEDFTQVGEHGTFSPSNPSRSTKTSPERPKAPNSGGFLLGRLRRNRNGDDGAKHSVTPSGSDKREVTLPPPPIDNEPPFGSLSQTGASSHVAREAQYPDILPRRVVSMQESKSSMPSMHRDTNARATTRPYAASVPGVQMVSNDDEYSRRYAAKVAESSVATSNRTNASVVATAAVGGNLVNEMNVEMEKLSSRITSRGEDLRRKEDEISTLDQELTEIDRKNEAVSNEIERSRQVFRDHEDQLAIKTCTIDDVQAQMRALGEQLRLEEVEAQEMSSKISSIGKSLSVMEEKLLNGSNERNKIAMLLQTREQERENLDRKIRNDDSELKSLEAIQNLALENPDMM